MTNCPHFPVTQWLIFNGNDEGWWLTWGPYCILNDSWVCVSLNWPVQEQMAPRVKSRHAHCACDNFEKCVCVCVCVSQFMSACLCICECVFTACVVFLFQHLLLQAIALNTNMLLVSQCGYIRIRKTSVFACLRVFFFFYSYACMPCHYICGVYFGSWEDMCTSCQ